MSALTIPELCGCLSSLMPSAAQAEVEKAASVLLVMFKVAGTTPAPAAKTAPKKRQYREKPLAESQRLKRG